MRRDENESEPGLTGRQDTARVTVHVALMVYVFVASWNFKYI